MLEFMAMARREYHYLAFHAIWERFVARTVEGERCRPALMYHSNALMTLEKHPLLSNFCGAILFDIAQGAFGAHPYVCKLLDILPEVS